MKNKFLFVLIFAIGFLALSSFAEAATITANTTETNINTTVLLTGAGFSPSTAYYLVPLLENKSAWWDGYNENWFFSVNKENKTINITTDGSGGFTYELYIPIDWRVSGGKVSFKVGEQVASSLLWSTTGNNFTVSPTKNGVTGDSDSNGFIYAGTNVAVANQGGITKHYKSNGALNCSWSDPTVENINDLTNNGSLLYFVTSATANNLRYVTMHNCTLVSNITTAGAAAYSVNIASDNKLLVITYAASTAPRMYNITNGTPVLMPLFNRTAIASIAYDSCISPNNAVVYIGYANGNVTAVNATNGSIIWNSNPPIYDLNATFTFQVNGLACDNDRVYVARSGVTVASIVNQGFVEALWASNGSRAWTNGKTNTIYDNMDVNNIRCDSNYCYAVKTVPSATLLYGGPGIAGSAIVQIDKTTGNITWQNWRSYLPTSSLGAYGSGGTQSSAQTLWVDTNTNGYLYPVYTNSWIQKIAKNDINPQIIETNLWIKGLTNFWNYVADVPKNVWLSNETPYYTFRHWNQLGVSLNTTNNIVMSGSYFRFSLLNAFNEFTATETTSSLFMDPVLQLLPTQANEIKMWNFTFATNCPVARYGTSLVGWHYTDRACHYEEIRANATGYNIGTTINGTWITGVIYSLIKTKFWENYPITKYYGGDNWAWAAFYNNTQNQVLGFATKFGSDQEEVYSDNFGRAVLFTNGAAAASYYRAQFRADLNRKTDNYIFFLPQTPDGNNTDYENTLWHRVDIETKKIANPINIALAADESGSFAISGNTYGNRIQFTAQEPNLFNRTNEPVEILFNAAGGIRSDCQDVIITDTSNIPINLWQADNYTSCSQNNNVSVWIMMDWNQSETKNLRLYYNSPSAVPSPAGTTDLVVNGFTGACSSGTQTINVSSTRWYNWTRVANASVGVESTKFNFNVTTDMWTSAIHLTLATCYKNSNTTSTGAGNLADSCATAVVPISRCLQAGGTGKIFAKLNATATIGAITGRPNADRIVNMEYYFFGNTGRVRIRTQLNQSIPIMNTTVSKNWPPYYYLSINNIVPPTAPNSWIYYSGLYEQMKKPAVVFNADQTEANLSASPLPMMFTVKYGGLNEVPQANGNVIRPSTLSDSFISNKGCTAHKMWQYYTYGVASYGAPDYTSEFISCSQNVSSLLPAMGSGGYVNVFPEVSWWGTTANRWYDPLLIGKFFMQSNLWRPFNRENRWLSPYLTATKPAAITSSYQATARITTYIIKRCPTYEYGYKGYDDFLADLPKTADEIDELKASGEIVTATTLNTTTGTLYSIPCAAQVRKWTDKNGADGQEIIFAKNLSVIVGETFSPGWNLSYNTYQSGLYTLQADGQLDNSFGMKASATTGFYGKWFFTYTPYNYVNHAFTTSGNPQFMSASQIPLLEASHAMVVRYSMAPEQPYVKQVFDESNLWEATSQNFSYYRNPCFLGRMNNIYGATELSRADAATPSTPGWQQTQWGGGAAYAGTLTCPFNSNQLEKALDFRPAWQSGYPVSTDVAGWNAPMVDGRENFVGTGVPPAATDTYYTDRHNALLDYKHYDDYNDVIGETSELSQNEKHPNKQPWYCQISRHTNRSFCVATSSLSTLVYNYNPGLGLTQSIGWSAYWSSVKEMSSFRNYFLRRFFDTSAWTWSYDHILEISLYPSLSNQETLYSNVIYNSNNADDYSMFFQKQFPTAQGSIDQNQFLLKDWKNSAFIVFDDNSRNYAAGLPMSIRGIAISNGNVLNDSNVTLGIYSENNILVQEIETQTNSSGMFNWTLTLPASMPAGLYSLNFNYSNIIIDSVEFRTIGLIAALSNDAAAYEQGDEVTTTVAITNSYTGANEDPDQLELRFKNPGNNVIACAKYPNESIVSGCENNLTKTATGSFYYSVPLGSNSTGVYTQIATVTEDGIAADFDSGFVIAIIDLCKPISAYSASNYPMSYNNVTDVLTIIGNSSFGTSSNPITFEQIFEFGQATRGTCIIDSPATGAYTIKSQLVIGNGTQEVYVSSKGESIGFTTESMPQLFINKSAHLSFGGIADGIPQEGSSVKFTANQSNDILLDVAGGELAFYDSYVGDVGDYLGRFIYRGSCGVSSEESSDVNSSITIKKTIFDRAARGQFFYTSNVTIDDMKLNRINSSSTSGYGIVSGCSLPALNNLQIYHQEQQGAGIFIAENTPNNTNLAITSSILDYNNKDVIANKGGRGVKLVNTQWDRSYGFNWTGDWEGITTIQESYGYLPLIVDTSSSAIANTSIILTDRYGNIKLSILTDSLGTIEEQNIPTWQVEKSTSESVSDFNPFNLKIKKYGKTFVSEPKTFSVRTVETKQLSGNPFTSLSESEALAIEGIIYSPPTKVSYSDEEDELVDSDNIITLDNSPITQSEFFGLYNDTGSTIPSSDYSVNYATGEVTFDEGYEAITARAVYSYGGSIQVIGNKTLSQIYDYTQANLSDVFTTQTGSIYDSYVNIILGNSTDAGTIREINELTLNFKEGYGFSSENANSATVNLQSTTWNFAWVGTSNQTFSRKYALDLTAAYSNGTVMEGANVTIATANSRIIFNGLTNSTGGIPHQEISYATYNYTGGSNATLLSPHAIDITKTGYIASSASVTVDSIQDLTYALYEESNPCDSDDDYAYALNYPIIYNTTTDILTIIGNNSIGISSNPITFDQIFEFARATKGSCIMQKPATGTYAVLSQLIVGNGTQEVYISSKGESIGFSSANMPELTINEKAHVSFGGIADGIPQEGCSIKFASNAPNDLLLDAAGGELAFYDSYITDAGISWGRFLFRGGCGNFSEGTYSNANSSITIKKTIFDRAARGQFFYTSNVTIDDMKVNRINSTANDGFGLVAGCTMPALNNLQIYHQEQEGGGIRTLENMPADTSLTITSSILDYNNKDVIANKDGRGVQLINTQWDRSYGFNWSGEWEGITTIKESYGYNPTFVDTSSSPIANLTLVLLNQYGEVEISKETESSGGIGEQYIPTWQVEKTLSSESESSFNSYTLYAKKYGKTFISEPKSFASRTLETKQVSENSFTILSEATASAVKNITYHAPTKVSYGEEINSSWTTSGQLVNYPVDQCQYFALFANGTKLAETSNYTIDYETGEITFVQSMAGMEIKPVYFYGGDITITNGFTLTGAYTMSKIYDYISYVTSKNNLSEDLITIDGLTYSFCVNFIIGSEIQRGSVSDSTATISFEDGYDMSFSGLGGYVDLAGITSGGGSSGGLPLNIFDSVGSSYAPGNTAYLFSTVLNSNGQLVDASVDLSVYLPNGTLYKEDSMTATSTGRLEYSLALPGDAQLGTWRINVDASYGAVEVHDNVAFLVSTSVGGGGGGGTTPSIQIDAPSIINTNENFAVYAFTRNNNSLLANCDSSASLTLRDATNGTIALNAVAMTNSGTGRYNYTASLSYQSTFLAEVSCAISGTTYVSNPKMISSLNVPTNNTGGTGGSAYPTIEILASTPIKTSSTASIGALVRSSNGVVSNCDVSLGLTIRNLADGTSSSGVMTNFGTGMYNYSWTTPATASVFYINSSCSISGTSYTGFTMLSTQDVGATANIDYNQIALYVWNYTSRNLTWYNQSVSESIQSCLKDEQCSEWWINTTFANIQNTINIINLTANQIKTNTESILSYLNCTSTNEVCTILQNILNNATDIQTRVYSLNTSQIPSLQTGLDNVYTDTQYLRTNMATASALSNIQSNITWLVNNVATQTNMTSISSQLSNLQIDLTWLKDNTVTQQNISNLLNRVTGIDNNLTEIRNVLDCSNPANSAFCTYLNSINTTINYVRDNMATYSQVSAIGTNVSWIRNNVATQEQVNSNFTEVVNRLTNMNSTLWNVHDDLTAVNSSLANQITNVQSNLTWLIGNVATQEQINNNFTEVFARLNGMNTTITDTNNYLYGEITNRLTEINTTAQNTYTYVLNNVSTKLDVALIKQDIDVINSTVNVIRTQTDCSNPTNSALCTYLNNINTTINSIYSEMATYSQVSGLQSNVTVIKDNMVTQSAFESNMSEIRSRLTEMNTTIDATYDYLTVTLTNNLNYINQTAIIIREEAVANNLSIQGKIGNLQSNLTWLINNVALSDVINANFSDLINRLSEINSTTQEINNAVDCSNPANSNLCTYLGDINATANLIYSDMATQALLQQVALNVSYVRENMATYSQVSAIGTNVSWIRNNVATQEQVNSNFTEVVNRLTNMNSTLWNVHDDLTAVNSSLANQITNVQSNLTWLIGNVATQEQINNNFSLVFAKLENINTTVSDTNAYLYGTIKDALSEINSTNNELKDYVYNQITNSLNQINLTTQESSSYLINNLSISTNLTEILTKLEGLSGNLTYVKNNMFYQGNATGAFLVDYLATVYAEKNSRAELWILTRDLLGNQKNVSNVDCQIFKHGALAEKYPTNEILSGQVHSYWDVPQNQEAGEYYWYCELTAGGSTLDLYVPFFVSSETSKFEITSLISASPKYPNENAIVEATFASQNGSVEPDSINLTIYKPNYLTIWYSADKDDFSFRNGIWYWTQMIEASPTTGTYYVNMKAEYKGYEDSRTIQFRIATGGPYKVYLECPTSSNVGSNLVCNVIIQDEGEAATESTTTIWVDTNGNSILDAGEPQTSFSKETQPMQNITETATINVPSSHATGSFVVRASTEYLNSGQPDSTASDSVTFQNSGSGTSVTPSSGGGGGGSSYGTVSFDADFTKERSYQFSAVQGSVKTFTFDGAVSHHVKIDLINGSKVTFIVSSEPITIVMNVGETEEIDINNDGLNDILISLKKINNGVVNYELRVLPAGASKITGRTINYPEHLMDVEAIILDDYKTVAPGSKILARIVLYNLGTEEIKDAYLTYCIRNAEEEEEEVKCLKETVAVYTKIELVKEFLVSKDMPPGRYYLDVVSLYGNETANSRASFLVTKDTANVSRQVRINQVVIFSILGILIAVIITAIIVFLRSRCAKKNKFVGKSVDANFRVISLEAKLKHLDELENNRVITKSAYLSEKNKLMEKIIDILKNAKAYGYLIFAGLILWIIVLSFGGQLSGLVTGEILSVPSLKFAVFSFLIILIIAFLIVFRKNVSAVGRNIKYFINSMNDKKHHSNSVFGLITKKVYSESGHYIGKVKEIFIEENKIESLQIKIDKKHKLKSKGIILDYKQVKSVGEVVIIDGKVLGHLTSS